MVNGCEQRDYLDGRGGRMRSLVTQWAAGKGGICIKKPQLQFAGTGDSLGLILER